MGHEGITDQPGDTGMKNFHERVDPERLERLYTAYEGTTLFLGQKPDGIAMILPYEAYLADTDQAEKFEKWLKDYYDLRLHAN